MLSTNICVNTTRSSSNCFDGFFVTKAGWKRIFTVHYCADSQPIEQVWAYIKNYVVLRWFVGRTHKQVRSQLICGLYGRVRAGAIADCCAEPLGLKAHEGITPERAVKFINHSLKAVNEYVQKHMPGMGPVGSWTQ